MNGIIDWAFAHTRTVLISLALVLLTGVIAYVVIPKESSPEIEIPTLDGSARIRVPAETQSGKTFRLKHKGIKGVRSQLPGDLFCHVVVETPVALTERQRQLLREFDAITQEDSGRHNPRAKGWLDKVKEFFEG